MKKPILLLSMLLLHSVGIAQFQRSFGTTSYDVGRSVKNLGNSYIIAGQSNSSFVGGAEATLVQSSLTGNQIWARKYGGESYDHFKDVDHLPAIAVNGLQLAAIGGTRSYGSGNEDVYMVGTNPIGIPLFQRTFGGEGFDRGHSIKYANDEYFGSGFALVGETRSFPTLFPGANVYVIRTNLNGIPLRSVIIGGLGDQRGYWIEQTKDEGYIIAGSSTRTCSVSPSLNNDIFIIKLRQDLTVQWSRVIGGISATNRNEVAYSIKENDDGTFIATGYSQSFSNPINTESFLLKLTNAGNLLWMKTYGGENTEIGYSLLTTLDAAGNQSYVVAGYTSGLNTTTPNANAYMFKTDVGGNLTWTRTYGRTGLETAYGLTNSDISGYTFTGGITSIGAGGYDIYLTETNPLGLSNSIICERRREQNEVRRSPCITPFGEYAFVNNYKIIQSPHITALYEPDKCGLTVILPADPTLEQRKEGLSVGQATTLYPNPVQNVLHVTMEEGFGQGKIEIFNATGGMVILEQAFKESKATINTAGLTKGLYLIQVTSNDGKTKRMRFIKD